MDKVNNVCKVGDYLVHSATLDYLVACVVIFPNIASSLSSKKLFHSLRHHSHQLIDNLSCSELISSSLSLAIDEDKQERIKISMQVYSSNSAQIYSNIRLAPGHNKLRDVSV